MGEDLEQVEGVQRKFDDFQKVNGIFVNSDAKTISAAKPVAGLQKSVPVLLCHQPSRSVGQLHQCTY